MIDYGPHGGSHGNYDKLHLEVFGAGERLAPDLGVPSSYSVSTYQDYYKKTFSHNTVEVDEQDQGIYKDAAGAETFDPTKLFLDAPDFKITTNTANHVYEQNGINRYERTVAVTNNYMLDLFKAGSSQPHTYDWLLHGIGQFAASSAMEPLSGSLGTANGYQYLQNASHTKAAGHWEGSWTTPAGNGLRLISLTNTPSDMIVGDLPGPASRTDKVSTVIDRVNGTDALFVSILEPFKGSSKIKDAERTDANILLSIWLTASNRYCILIRMMRTAGLATLMSTVKGTMLVRRRSVPR